MTLRPVLGIVCCTRTVGIEPAQAVMNRYVAGAMEYGDVASLLVPSLPELMTAREVAPRLDGILLTGSPSNLDPEMYGQAGVGEADGPFDPARDATTRALIEAILELRRPVFGVCRGLQEVNVAFGGTLRRDASASAGLIAHHAPASAGFAEMFDHTHDVRLKPGGVLSQTFGREDLRVNSVHYQGIDKLGAGLGVEATAPDGMVEGVFASIDGAPVLAVQWHPEWKTSDNPDSQAFFRLLGRALRGEIISSV